MAPDACGLVRACLDEDPGSLISKSCCSFYVVGALAIVIATAVALQRRDTWPRVRQDGEDGEDGRLHGQRAIRRHGHGQDGLHGHDGEGLEGRHGQDGQDGWLPAPT